ncbi:methyltransferase domain-containing protein [candidate division KSB1 bacterium]
MRQEIKDFVAICVDAFTFPEPIYEFGSLQVSDQVGFADLRPLFPGKEFVGADMQEGPGVDVVLDLHAIDLPSESVGAILSLDTLEHVEYPRKAMAEMRRVLKPGGLCVISSHMLFPIHSYPNDYWRFTPEGFKSLLGVFPITFVEYGGHQLIPHTVLGIGFLRESMADNEWNSFKDQFIQWKKTWGKQENLVIKGGKANLGGNPD